MNTGNFFAIDRHAWARVCDLGVNQAISFLILARGTGGDNRTTSWSVNAIEERTAISRPRAKLAVRSIVDNNLAEIVVAGTRPRYKLAVGDIPRTKQDSLKALDRALIDQVERAGRLWIDGRRKSEIARASQLVGLRFLVHEDGYYSIAAPELDKAEPEWIWLPNAIADGLRGETPPVEILRQSNSIDAIRMFANLYADHDIRDDAGLPWRSNEGIRRLFERKEINRQGEYVVWGFPTWQTTVSSTLLAVSEFKRVRGSWDGFWNAEHVLVDTGLMQYVAHLVHSHDEQGEVFHPMPIREEGEPAEVRLAFAARRAAEAMIPSHAETSKFWTLAPVKRHMRDVQLVGIARLRYRPQTSATASWTAKAAEWDRWADAYTKMGDEALGTMSHVRVVATSR